MKKKVLASILAMTLIFCSTANVVLAEDADVSETEVIEEEIIEEEIIEEGDGAEPDEALEIEEESGEIVEDEDISTDVEYADSGTCGDHLIWELDENGVLTISGTGDMYFEDEWNAPWDPSKVTKVIIENGVESIAKCAFYKCKNITEITIPESVAYIDEFAFYGCSSLTEIVIPEGVSFLPYYAFCDCSSLRKITIPESVTDMDSGVFYGCSSLTAISLPSEMYTIPRQAFYECTSLTEIVIPDKVEIIGASAFEGCSSLEDIVIPKSVTYIEVNAFEGTPWAEKNTDENGFLVVNNMLVSCTSDAETVSIPDGITSISEQAFAGNSSIKSVEIPGSVEEIYEKVFYNCENLTDVNIPDSITSIQYAVFEGCASLTNVEIPDSVNEISDYSFYDTGLTSIVVPESVEYIGEYALGYRSSEPVDDTGTTKPVPVEGFTIYGYLGSEAETYADENSFDFIAIGESKTGLRIVSEKTDEIYVRGSGTGAVIYCTGEFSKFVSVEMDGVLVDPSNYTVVEGSTVLTFASAYLDTLSLGRHVVTLNYIDDSISTFLTIVEKGDANSGSSSGVTGTNSGNSSAGNTNDSDTVKTGDDANIVLWLVLGMSAIVVCVFSYRFRRRSAKR